MPLSPTIASTHNHDMESSDILVLYGITGDLAKKMLLPALYRLTERGLLTVPVVGVASSDYDDEALRAHARQSVIEAGYTIDEKVFERFAAGLSIVTGDFTDPAIYAKIGRAVAGKGFAAHCLAIPPSLLGAGASSRGSWSRPSRSATSPGAGVRRRRRS